MTKKVNVFQPKQDEKPKEKQSEKKTLLSKETLIQQQKIDQTVAKMPKEYGGRPEDKGKEPTRYGDWEFKGRCIDF